MFESLKARLERLLGDTGDAGQRAALLREAAVEARVGLGRLREALAAVERELAAERQQLADAERRGGLAAAIDDRETVAVAERFAARHRERVAVLAQKAQVQREEVRLAERDVAELTAQLKASPAAEASVRAAWRDLEAAGAARPETDLDGSLERARADAEATRAAVDAQLAYLKKKLGRE